MAALTQGEDPVAAATIATAVGAFSVESPEATTGIASWTEVARRLEAGWPRASLNPSLTGGLAWQTDAFGTHFDPSRRSRDEDA